MIPERLIRVAELIRREISNIIQQELYEPDLGFITVTKVTVTKDLKQAVIWVSVMGDEEIKKKSIEILTNQRRHIWELLAHRVRLKYLPTFQFRLDISIEKSVQIGNIISRLRQEEKWDE